MNDAPVVQDVMRLSSSPSESDIEHMNHLKQLGNELHDVMDTYGKGRHMSIAKTQLEIAIAMAVKDVTGN